MAIGRFVRLAGSAWLAALSLLPLPATAQTVSWATAIERVESAAERYRAYAHRHDTTWAGAMYNDWHITRHTCAILGRMLRQVEHIRHLEEIDHPPLPEPPPDDFYAHEMLVFSISLENWAFVARKLVAASEVECINTWNLTCVGYLDIPEATALASPRPEADFVRDGTWLRVLGDIDRGFIGRFRAALDANPGINEVVLGSDGGSVADALAAGRLIRARGLKTTLGGNCNSACPLVFLGGRERIVWASTARLGFHQISRSGLAVPATDPIYAQVAVYIAEMGGDPLALTRWMLSAPPSEMARPEPADYCALGLATWVQRICGW